MFYGWWIVAVAFLTHGVATGTVFYGFGVFLPVLIEHFGWTRAQAGLGFSLVSLGAAIYSPAVGRAVDRFGPRPVQLLGALALAIGFVGLGHLDSLGEFYLLMAVVVALGSTALGNIPSNAAVARWFVRRRGQALGIATAGISMGGVVFVPLTQWLIERRGWRDAFSRLAILTVAICVPAVLCFMRRSPESMGLGADGDRQRQASADPRVREELGRSWTARQAVRSRAFWLIAVAFALSGSALSTVLMVLVGYLRERGLASAPAAWVLGATAAVGVLGKLGFGTLLDRLGERHAIVWCFVLQALGIALLLVPAGWATAAYVVIFGFAMGGHAPLYAALVGICFGRGHYGAILGWMMPLLISAQVVALPLVGAMRDATGSYQLAFASLVVAELVAALCIVGLRTGVSTAFDAREA
jgi:MFS family permease